MNIINQLRQKLRRNLDHLQNNGLTGFLQDKGFHHRLIHQYWKSKYRWHPCHWFSRAESMNIHSPVFLLGLQGTGGTLVSRVIRRYPDLVYITGNCRFWTGDDEIHNNTRFKHLSDCWQLRAPRYHNMLGHEHHHPLFGYERSDVFATDALYGQFRRTADDWSPELQAELVNLIKQCLLAYGFKGRDLRFTDMSQTYILKIPLLRQCLPEPQFIILARNPYAACWRLAAYSSVYQNFNQTLSYQHAVTLAAEHWANAYSTALNDAHPDDSLQLTYEDFVQSPVHYTRQIFQFLGYPDIDCQRLIDANDQPPLGSKSREKWFPVKTNVNERYLCTIPDWAIDIIEQKCQPTAEQFGYYPPRRSSSFKN